MANLKAEVPAKQHAPGLLQQLLLSILFAGLMSASYLDTDRYYMAWIAFTPLLLAIEKTTLARTYTLGLLAGFASFIAGTHWIADFIMISKGFSQIVSMSVALLMWLYCAHFFALLVVVFNWLKKHTKVHEFLLFPLVVVTFTSAFPMVFSVRLGESQSSFLIALQATEFVGVHGLDAIMALANILVYRCLSALFSSHTKRLTMNKWPWIISISLITTWFAYGASAYSSWESKIASWDKLKIGIVQPNETPVLGKTTSYPGYNRAYPPEMEVSERLANLGAEIVIWPEAQTKAYLDNPRIRNAYQENIDRLGLTLLFQDMQHVLDPVSHHLEPQFNTAIMLDERGQLAATYQKIKRIPFGEYLPFVKDNSALEKWAQELGGEFLSNLSEGKHHQLFKHEKLNIVPLICYETTFPVFVANAINTTRKKANSDNGTVLVGFTNDGWFGSAPQSYQHVMASVLRAVENRLPLVHAVNNGPSLVVAPNGKIIFAGGSRQAGGYIADLPYSKSAQGSFYSRYPGLFDYIVYVLLFLITACAIVNIGYRNKTLA